MMITNVAITHMTVFRQGLFANLCHKDNIHLSRRHLVRIHEYFRQTQFSLFSGAFDFRKTDWHGRVYELSMEENNENSNLKLC